MITLTQKDQIIMFEAGLRLSSQGSIRHRQLNHLLFVLKNAGAIGWDIRSSMPKQHMPDFENLINLQAARTALNSAREVEISEAYNYLTRPRDKQDEAAERQADEAGERKTDSRQRAPGSAPLVDRRFLENVDDNPAVAVDRILRDGYEALLASLQIFKTAKFKEELRPETIRDVVDSIAPIRRGGKSDHLISGFGARQSRSLAPQSSGSTGFDQFDQFILRYTYNSVHEPSESEFMRALTSLAIDHPNGERTLFYALARYKIQMMQEAGERVDDGPRGIEQQSREIAERFSEKGLLRRAGYISQRPANDSGPSVNGFWIDPSYLPYFREPAFDRSSVLARDLGEIIPFKQPLDKFRNDPALSRWIDVTIDSILNRTPCLRVVHGDPGGGKSTLMAAIADELARRTGRPWRAYDVLSLAKATETESRMATAPRVARRALWLAHLMDAPAVLVLDEIDSVAVENASGVPSKDDWNRLYNTNTYGPLFGTSNAPPEKYEVSLRDRIHFIQMPLTKILSLEDIIRDGITRCTEAVVFKDLVMIEDTNKAVREFGLMAQPLGPRKLGSLMNDLVAVVRERNINTRDELLSELRDMLKKESKGYKSELPDNHKPPALLYPELWQVRTEKHRSLFALISDLKKALDDFHEEAALEEKRSEWRRNLRSRRGEPEPKKTEKSREWWGQVFLLYGEDGTGKTEFLWKMSDDFGAHALQIVKFDSVWSKEDGLNKDRLERIRDYALHNSLMIGFKDKEDGEKIAPILSDAVRNAGFFTPFHKHKIPTGVIVDCDPGRTLVGDERFLREFTGVGLFSPYSIDDHNGDWKAYRKFIADVAIKFQNRRKSVWENLGVDFALGWDSTHLPDRITLGEIVNMVERVSERRGAEATLREVLESLARPPVGEGQQGKVKLLT